MFEVQYYKMWTYFKDKHYRFVVEAIYRNQFVAGSKFIIVICEGACVVLWWHVGLLANRSSNRTCARSMIQKQNSSHSSILSPAQDSLTVQNRGLKDQSFHFICNLRMANNGIVIALYNIVYPSISFSNSC